MSQDQPQEKAISSTRSTPDSTLMVKEKISVPTSTQKEGRKQLPAIPDTQTQATMAAEQKQKQNSVVKSTANGYGQYFTEYSLMAEYNLLMKQKCPGCYVVPSAMTPLIWHGVLFVRQGLYQEGVFRFTLTIPENFPDGDCPNLVFSFPVFHPLVDTQTGELDVKRAFQKWRKNTNHIWQVLLYARRVFYKIDTKLPWNKEAATLYESDLEEFKKRITETVNKSKEKIHDPVKSDDPHILRFSTLSPSVHDDTRKQMTSRQDDTNDNEEMTSTKGLSWMTSGSVQIFSREDSALA